MTDGESSLKLSVLDPLDVAARINEFKILKDGWLDGRGLAPPHDGLDWLAGKLLQHFSNGSPLPYLYPTAEGGIRAEWSMKPFELSLEIDLAKRTGKWHSLNLDNDEEDIHSLKLDDAGWKWLISVVQRHGEGG